MSKREREIISLPLDVPRELFEKFKRDVSKKAFKYITPYSLAQQYSVKVSVARKLLKIASKHGLIELYSSGRTPIYVVK